MINLPVAVLVMYLVAGATPCLAQGAMLTSDPLVEATSFLQSLQRREWNAAASYVSPSTVRQLSAAWRASIRRAITNSGISEGSQDLAAQVSEVTGIKTLEDLAEVTEIDLLVSFWKYQESEDRPWEFKVENVVTQHGISTIRYSTIYHGRSGVVGDPSVMILEKSGSRWMVKSAGGVADLERF